MSRTTFRTFSLLMATLSVLACCLSAGAQAQVPIAESAPPAPTGLIASGRVNGNIQLTWDNVSAPAVSEYHIFRFENYSPSTTLKPIGVVPRYATTPKKVTYTDTTTIPARTYTYFLTSKDRFGTQSNNSKMSTATAPTPPPPPHTR